MEKLQWLGAILGASGFTALIGWLTGRRQAKANAQNTEVKTTKELLEAFSDTLKMVREGEERHAELTLKLLERDKRIAELDATLAAKESALVSLNQRFASMPARVSDLTGKVSDIAGQLKEIIATLSRQEANGNTNHEG